MEMSCIVRAGHTAWYLKCPTSFSWCLIDGVSCTQSCIGHSTCLAYDLQCLIDEVPCTQSCTWNAMRPGFNTQYTAFFYIPQWTKSPYCPIWGSFTEWFTTNSLDSFALARTRWRAHTILLTCKSCAWQFRGRPRLERKPPTPSRTTALIFSVYNKPWFVGVLCEI